MVTFSGTHTWDPNGGPGRPRLTPGRAGGRNISIKALFFLNILPVMCVRRGCRKKIKKRDQCRVLMGVLKKKFVFFFITSDRGCQSSYRGGKLHGYSFTSSRLLETEKL
ncbi:hypothetical protein CEXT_744071 [Caerostris extrusa]|uniref:Uncharacterized protein n=1 Tax=Caerostris extrusa TaxID=172846 RepID=A0AAV4Q6X3_CAEEX|nr:hypothetical protein CEXT_744071 [Caerostris extrusa]